MYNEHFLKEFTGSKNSVLPFPFKVFSFFLNLLIKLLKITHDWGFFVDKLFNMFHND